MGADGERLLGWPGEVCAAQPVYVRPKRKTKAEPSAKVIALRQEIDQLVFAGGGWLAAACKLQVTEASLRRQRGGTEGVLRLLADSLRRGAPIKPTVEIDFSSVDAS